MSQVLGRSLLSPYLISQLYQNVESHGFKNTLIHINDIMSHLYSEDDVAYQRSLLSINKHSSNSYNRYIRDARQREENERHSHSDLPICHRDEIPSTSHMPHDDFSIIMKEGDTVAPNLPASRVFESIGLIRSFFEEKLNIEKMFGCDADINAVIHYGKNYSNAFWNSQAIFFGDGDGKVFGPFYNDIDIIAHELAHGYISSQANFSYAYQSGALNESVADVLGIMVKQYVNNQTSLESNWLLGENLFIDKTKAPALRSMKEPGTAYYFSRYNNDQQVGHMSDYHELSFDKDNGGVHLNSGIPNKVFYLLATELGGYSWEIAGKIWIAAVSDARITTHATFVDFANATIRAAKDLFTEEIQMKTQKAWEDVGLTIELNVNAQ